MNNRRILKVIGIGLLILLIGSLHRGDYFSYKDNKDFDYIGYFLVTDKNYFFVAIGDSLRFTNNEFLKIFPVDETFTSSMAKVSFEGLRSGDMIGIDIIAIGDLNPRVMDIYRIGLLKEGDVSNIDKSVIDAIIELGFQVIN